MGGRGTQVRSAQTVEECLLDGVSSYQRPNARESGTANVVFPLPGGPVIATTMVGKA